MTSWQTIPAVNNTDVSTAEHFNAIITDMNLLKSPTSAYWEATGLEPSTIATGGVVYNMGEADFTFTGRPVLVAWRFPFPTDSTYTNYDLNLVVYNSAGAGVVAWTLPNASLFNTPFLSQIAAGFTQVFSGFFVAVSSPYTLPSNGTYTIKFAFNHTLSGGGSKTFSWATKPAFLLVELP